MQRRDFIQLGLAGIGAGMVAPATGFAGAAQPPAAADLVYSEQSQGRWAGKAAAHVPTIDISTAGGKTTISLVNAHEMKGFEHYIVKHVLLDHKLQFIAEHMFNPATDKVARSEFTLDRYQGTLYALSLCNKHDLWLNAITL